MGNLNRGLLIILCILLFLSCNRNTQNNQNNEAINQNLNEDISEHSPPALETPWSTWQEAYAALLWNYTSQCPYAAEFPLAAEERWGWHFALHDIDRNGIPELFSIMRHSTGHASYSAIYTFVDGKLVPVEFQGITTDGGVFVPLNNETFIIHIHPTFGNSYRRLELDGLALVATASGESRYNEAGEEKMFGDIEVEDPNWWQSYEWFDLYIWTDDWNNRQLVTAQEFESIFLRHDERKWLEMLAITDENIEQFIFGKN